MFFINNIKLNKTINVIIYVFYFIKKNVISARNQLIVNTFMPDTLNITTLLVSNQVPKLPAGNIIT